MSRRPSTEVAVHCTPGVHGSTACMEGYRQWEINACALTDNKAMVTCGILRDQLTEATEVSCGQRTAEGGGWDGCRPLGATRRHTSMHETPVSRGPPILNATSNCFILFVPAESTSASASHTCVERANTRRIRLSDGSRAYPLTSLFH